MKPDSHIYTRKNIRLKGYDYSGAGSYFVTICTRNRESFFGIVLNDEIHINDIGRIAMECWISMTERFPEISLDEFVFMPNHLHGIINISDDRGIINAGAMNRAPTEYNINCPVRAQFIAPANHEGAMNRTPTAYKANSRTGAIHCAHNNQGVTNHAPTLGMVVRLFKALASRQIRSSGRDEFAWQRNYYEHVIRDEDSLEHIREYIITNPLRWEMDRENPDRKGEDEFDRWLNSRRVINKSVR